VLGHDPATAGGGWRDRVGVVLQESEPEPGLSVRECLAMYAGFYRAPRDIDETIALAGLTEKAGALGTRLSGGQRRRLDFALALIGDPELKDAHVNRVPLRCDAMHPGSTRRRDSSGKATEGHEVDYVKLGSAGLKVSRICLGMMSYGSQAERAWHLDEAAAEPIVKAAADGGITFFDTADTYSGGVTEQITGRLLGRLFDHREDYVLATKVYFPMGPGPNDRGLSRRHVLAAIDTHPVLGHG
jgi:hypothetical protein